MVVAFVLLAAALLSLWLGGDKRLGRAPLWAWLAAGALGAALAAGVVRPLGALGVAAWAGVVAWWSREAASRWSRGAAAGAVLGLATALFMHRVPGFANPRVIDAVRFTPDAVPFSLHLNFDKALVGLLLLAWAHPRIASAREWRGVLRATVPRALVVLGVVLAGSLALGYVRWAPKCPEEAWLWLGVNLLFTCTAEEALFRGFVQGELRRAWAERRGGSWAALAVAAGLFGLAHAAGGWRYVLMATVAGAGYGWIYDRTHRVEASILAHWGLNALHFFLFTYPALAR